MWAFFGPGRRTTSIRHRFIIPTHSIWLCESITAPVRQPCSTRTGIESTDDRKTPFQWEADSSHGRHTSTNSTTSVGAPQSNFNTNSGTRIILLIWGSSHADLDAALVHPQRCHGVAFRIPVSVLRITWCCSSQPRRSTHSGKSQGLAGPTVKNGGHRGVIQIQQMPADF